ncbi:MAG: YbjN domain-containing protein [Coriobacteriales bacterium]|jgi:hypothetical protein|nr:YbjN domain-containing protein [Coriobacteriales bacterium]
MGDKTKTSNATATYATIKSYFDKRGWHYEADDKELTIHYNIRGKDLDACFFIETNGKGERITVASFLPFSLPTEKLEEAMWACCLINTTLLSGSFSVVTEMREIIYRNSSRYKDMVVTAEIIDEIVSYSNKLMDTYSLKLLAFSRGYIGLNDVLAKPSKTVE